MHNPKNVYFVYVQKILPISRNNHKVLRPRSLLGDSEDSNAALKWNDKLRLGTFLNLVTTFVEGTVSELFLWAFGVHLTPMLEQNIKLTHLNVV